MMLSEEQKRLLLCFLDQTLDSAEKESVIELLRHSTAAREFVRDVAEQAVVVADVERIELARNGKNSPMRRAPGDSAAPSFTLSRILALLSLAATVAVLASFATYAWLASQSNEPATIAKIVDFKGKLQWKGDGGIVYDDIDPGYELSGGTLDCFADSWAKLEMMDGSQLTLVGPGELTISDHGQKVFYLDGGNLSADVRKQPPGLPLVIHTPTARLDVLGTQLNVDAQNISTTLTVNEGNVRMTRLIDGSDCEVPAEHQAVASLDRSESMESKMRLAPINEWNVDFASEPKSFFGKWLPPVGEFDGRLITKPKFWASADNKTKLLLHLIWVPSTNWEQLSAPVVLESTSRFHIRGRLKDKSKPFYFLVRTNKLGSGFSGSYMCTVQPEDLDFDGDVWAVNLPISKFVPDPENEALKKTQNIETFETPVGLQMESVVLTETNEIGLELVSVELTSD